MKPERDFNGLWRIPGYWHLTFSTEADAIAAAELAVSFAIAATRIAKS